MDYQGLITHLLPEELVGKNQLRKRVMVLEEITDREYKGGIVVDFIGDKCDLLNGFKVGDQVKVSLNFRANEYNWRRYNGINGWRVDSLGGGWAAPQAPMAWWAAPAPSAYEDDLPF